MTRILIIGGMAFDTIIYLNDYPPTAETVFPAAYQDNIGATGAGKAVAFRRLDCDVTLQGMIGADMYGDVVRQRLESDGINLLTDLDPAGTQRHVNLMYGDGQRVSLTIQPGTFEPAFDHDRLRAQIPQHDVIALNIFNYCRRLIPDIKAADKAIWCDIHDYDGENTYHHEFIAAADYLFVSSSALPDYRAFMQAQMATGKQLIVCTHGKNGSTALTPDGTWIKTPAPAGYKTVDSNGAGDSFFAGVVYGLGAGLPLTVALQYGSIAGGLAVTSHEIAAPNLSPQTLRAEWQRLYA